MQANKRNLEARIMQNVLVIASPAISVSTVLPGYCGKDLKLSGQIVRAQRLEPLGLLLWNVEFSECLSLI